MEPRVLMAAWIDTTDRAAVLAAYTNDYLSSAGVTEGWTGSYQTGDPGTTSAAFKAAVLRRINYFRAMGGVPPLTGLDATYSAKAQAAALMMSANNSLSHSPPATWRFYTAAGAEGAGNSNLAIGADGAGAVDLYMADGGSGNTAVGHRRWVLYPQTQVMGTGDVPGASGFSRANALWVFDHARMWGTRPETRTPWVAWPPAGYTPSQLVPPRWSFTYAGADFSGAQVTVLRAGAPVAVTVHAVANGYGENTLVWEVAGSVNTPETLLSVRVSNVKVLGVARTFEYAVTPISTTNVVIPGDTNGDKKVDAYDLNVVSAHWQGSTFEGIAGGDFNGDMSVNAFDLNILASRWQTGVTGSVEAAEVTFAEAFQQALGATAVSAGFVEKSGVRRGAGPVRAGQRGAGVEFWQSRRRVPAPARAVRGILESTWTLRSSTTA